MNVIKYVLIMIQINVKIKITKVYMINEKNKIDKELFDSLGFYWNRLMIPENVPIHNINRVCFRLQKMLAQYIWEASILDKITFTYPQVQTINDGITVGSYKISDQNHVINLASSTKELISLVKTNEFKLNKKTFTYINSIVTRKYSFEWSEFSNKEKSLNNGNMNFMDGYITKNPLNVELNSIFFDGINKLEMILNPLERGIRHVS